MIDRKIDLTAVKRAAKSAFSSLDGVEGVGIGDGRLRVYVRNEQAARQIPFEFQGVELETVVSGEAKAQASTLNPLLKI